MKIDVKRAVSNNGKVHFVHFVGTSETGEDSKLVYRTDFNEEFSVSLAETRGAIFKREDKAIYFMRWMNAWNKMIDDAK